MCPTSRGDELLLDFLKNGIFPRKAGLQKEPLRDGAVYHWLPIVLSYGSLIGRLGSGLPCIQGDILQALLECASIRDCRFRTGGHVIARIWHGYTKPEHADAYEAMLKPELLPGISKAPGYKGSYLLRRRAGEEVEFITIMLWDSIDAIRAVAGPDYERAVIPEERRKYLSRYDAKSAHYEIVSMQRPSELSSTIP
jgi:heme-degrading monooxygenase HmoA